MANWTVLKAAIANIIKTNGNQEITGAALQNTLNSIVNAVGENATFAGIATPSTNPGAPDGPVFYLATAAGVYVNFNGIEVSEGEAAILLWNNGTWSKKNSGLATEQEIIYDVSSRNGGAVFESLQVLLSSSNLSTLIPTSVRHGGMSIRFIQGPDNKYVLYRLINKDWSINTNDWQEIGSAEFSTGEKVNEVGIDNIPTENSNNLLKSGGVFTAIQNNSQIRYYECNTSADTAAKTIVASDYILPTSGGSIKIKMVNANTAASGVTLKIGNNDAKPLYYDGLEVSKLNTWQAGETVEVYYDGTNYYANNVRLPDTQKNVFNIIANTTNTCYYTDGRTYKGQNWTSGEKQAIITGYRMAGKMNVYGNMPAVVFFDSDDNMCGYIGNLPNGGIVTYDTNIDEIPNNAVTFQLQGSNKSADVASGQCIVYYPFTTLEKRVVQLEEDEIVKITIKNVRPSVETSTYKPDGTMFHYSTWGITQGNYNVQRGDKLIGLILAHPNVPPIVFFDNSNNFICTMPTNVENDYTRINIVVPENAAYFIVQSRLITSERNNLAIHRTVNSCLEGMVNVYGDNEDSFPALSLIMPRTFYSVLNNITNTPNMNYSKRTYSSVFYLDNFFTGLTKEPKSVFFKNYVRKIGIRFPSIGNTGYVEETLDYSIIGNTVENQDFSIKHRACLLSPSKDKKISVICIGDSITFGQNAYFVDRVKQRSYPMIINEIGYKDYLESQQQGYSIRLLGRNKITHSFTYNDNNYTISTFHEGRQGDSLQDFMSRAENKDAGGNFSLAAYIKKYRTCDDNGNRLYFDVNQGTTGTAGANNTGYLADGTDSGFKIGSTISNTLSVDVYKPSHVFLFMCTNAAYSVENLETFIAGIKTAGNDIIIGVGCPHYAGTYFPSDYQDFIGAEHWVLGESTPQITQQTLLNTLDRETYESENVFFIDTYWTNQGAWSASCAPANELAADFVNDSVFKKYRPVGQGIYQHVSAYAHAAYAQQIYAWLKWTAAKNLFNR